MRKNKFNPDDPWARGLAKHKPHLHPDKLGAWCISYPTLPLCSEKELEENLSACRMYLWRTGKRK